MSINIFGNQATVLHAKSNFSFATAGFNTDNIEVIFEVGEALKSWQPGRTINAITGATAGNGYYVVAKVDMDKTAYFGPPFDVPFNNTTNDFEILDATKGFIRKSPNGERFKEVQNDDGSLGLSRISDSKNFKVLTDFEIQPRKTTVFTHAVDFSSNYFRIPFCELTNNKILIVGSDVRYNGSSDIGNISTGIARSKDLGTTFFDKKIVLPNNAVVSQSRKIDACILVDRITNRVFIFAHQIDSAQAWETETVPANITVGFVYSFSDDDGATFGTERNLNYLKDGTMVSIMPAPGVGITMANGTLVVPVQIKNTHNNPAIQSGIITSVDRGVTWVFGSRVPVRSSECQVVEYKPGELMLNCRSDVSQRRVYTTTDLGVTWVRHTTDCVGLIEPTACQASFNKIKINNVEYGLFGNPNTYESRKNITVKITDDYINWKEFYKAYPGTTNGYSCISVFDGEIFLALELLGDIEVHRLTNLTSNVQQSGGALSKTHFIVKSDNFDSADKSITISPSCSSINVDLQNTWVSGTPETKVIELIKGGTVGQVIHIVKTVTNQSEFYLKVQPNGGEGSILGNAATTTKADATAIVHTDYVTCFTNKVVSLVYVKDKKWVIFSERVHAKNEQVLYLPADGYITVTPGMKNIFIDMANSVGTALVGIKGAYVGQELNITSLNSTSPMPLTISSTVSDYDETQISSAVSYPLWHSLNTTFANSLIDTVLFSTQWLRVVISRGRAAIMNTEALTKRQFTKGLTLTFNGATTAFSVTHGLGRTPTVAPRIIPTNAAAASAGAFYINTLTSTNFTINFVNAPAAGSGTFDVVSL